jgi:hypothetical protein
MRADAAGAQSNSSELFLRPIAFRQKVYGVSDVDRFDFLAGRVVFRTHAGVSQASFSQV